MPPGGAEADAEQYADIVSYILQRTAQPPARRPSPRHQRRSPIATVATGAARRRPPRRAAAAGRRPVAAAMARRGRPPAGSRRAATRSTGEVKNYVPVTDAMLRNPPPGDWLMVRRNYQAWSYSPLDEITRDNVKDLRLAWVWSMNDGGANQPTPLVHNGIIYLANTSNIVQALDGRPAN